MARKLTLEELNKEFELLGIEFLNYDGANKPVTLKFKDGTTKSYTRATKAIEYYKTKKPLNENAAEEMHREKLLSPYGASENIPTFEEIIKEYGNVIELKKFAYGTKLPYGSASSILDKHRREGKLKLEYQLNNGVYQLIYKAA